MFCLEFIDCKEHLGFGGGRGADQDQDQDCATWWQNSGPTETREPIIKILKNCAVFLFLYLFFRSKYSMFWDQVFLSFLGTQIFWYCHLVAKLRSHEDAGTDLSTGYNQRAHRCVRTNYQPSLGS